MSKQFKKLEEYLEEIDHHLAVEQGGEDILAEIREHILEKAEREHGQLTEETIDMTIAQYGSAKEVAEKYLEGFHIISPAYRKYLFRYTWILFLAHYGVICLAFIFKVSIHMFPPLFSIPRLKNFFELLAQLPMTLVYDFGLVGLALFFVTQMKERVKLPWPKFLGRGAKKGEAKLYTPDRPRWYGLLGWTLGLTAAISVYSYFGTLFFRSLNPGSPEPLFTPLASTFYSLLVIAAIGMEMICYLIRFFYNSYWVDLVKNAIFLFTLWFIINYPLENAFLKFPYFDLKSAAAWILIILTILISLETLSYIYKLLRNALASPADRK